MSKRFEKFFDCNDIIKNSNLKTFLTKFLQKVNISIMKYSCQFQLGIPINAAQGSHAPGKP